VTKILLAGIGGFIGSALRYWASAHIHGLTKESLFPYATLTVNVFGCFVIGFLFYLAEAREMFTAESTALLFVGFLGGVTTFSTFGNETVNLLRGSEYVIALAYVGAHLFLGLGSVFAGRSVAELMCR
jgi:fluoride exporter